MISRITGILIEKQPPYLLIDINGLGYEVSVPMTTLYKLPNIGEKITLYTHFIVREDSQALYGFIEKSDRLLFKQLLKVSGVGAKVAVSILSGIETDSFVQCILNNNISTLSKIPGIGKKTAERLVIEMQDKVSSWDQAQIANVQKSSTPSRTRTISNIDYSLQDAIDALVALGYKPFDASKAVNRINNKEPGLSSDQLIKASLKTMLI